MVFINKYTALAARGKKTAAFEKTPVAGMAVAHPTEAAQRPSLKGRRTGRKGMKELMKFLEEEDLKAIEYEIDQRVVLPKVNAVVMITVFAGSLFCMLRARSPETASQYLAATAVLMLVFVLVSAIAMKLRRWWRHLVISRDCDLT